MNSWPVTFSLPQGFTVGGVTTWAVQLAEALADTGREARLVVHQSHLDCRETEFVSPALRPNLSVIRAPRLTDPTAWQACLRLYRDLLPTVLSPNLLAASYALAAALATVHPERLRVIGWCHSDNPYDYEHLAYYEPIVHRYVAGSRHCLTELSRRMPLRAGQVEHLPYGVHVPAEQPRPSLATRPIRLLYAGRIEQAGKRVFGFVTLAELLDRRGVRFALRLHGDGPQRAELGRRIAATTAKFTHPGNRIWLEPCVPREQVPAMWSWADAALVNSIREGFSIAMVESMACGCVPVVSRVSSGVADIVQERHNGLTFPTDDLDALADRIEWLAGDEAALRRMSRAARQTAQAHSGYDRFCERVVKVIDRAVRDEDRPWPPGRTLRMDAPDAPIDATVPGDAPDRLRGLLERISRSEGGPIAIYGAGHHTRSLAPIWAESPVEIVAVIDDDYGLCGGRLWGWPIVSPDAAHQTRARSVVISSWMYETEIWQRQSGPLEAAGLEVFRLYARTPPVLAAPSS